MGKLGSVTGRCFIVIVLFLSLISSHLLLNDARGSNFATHGGLAESTLDNEFFVAGAFLADVGYFLPGSPASDIPSFTNGLVDRAKSGSNELRYFVMGWYEHLDQDSEFFDSVQTIRSVHPEYTTSDVRLAFDYLSITRHPTDVNITFIMNHTEILEAVRIGFTGVSTAQLRQAIWDFVHSYSAQQPGLLYQMDAAMVYSVVYPDRIAEMEAEYESYVGRVTASYYNPFLGYFTNDVQKDDIDTIRTGYRNIPYHLRKVFAPKIADNIPSRN
ncbi:MAG: hypothetical protein KAW09_02255 [Thermoplasmata archaeon]|nr:hypothetical protein [Thermoplasmata archaeon]